VAVTAPRRLAPALLASAALATGACASTTLVTPKTVDERDFHCARAIMDGTSPYRMPLAGGEPDPALAAHLAGLPYRARRAALAAGLEPLLARLLAAHQATASGPASVESLNLEEELALRMLAFHAQIESAAFEAGCTADMLQKVLPEFAHREQSRQLTIAIGSVVAGALSGIAAGIWSLENSASRFPAIIGIAGGGATAALGTAALTHGTGVVRLDHARNRLVPVLRGTDPDHLYPSFVFRMLTYPDASDGKSPRDELLAAWQRQMEDNIEGPDQAAARERLLSDGGTYDEPLLTLRAEMFESLESTIRGMARDLELLNRSLVRSLTPLPPPAALPAVPGLGGAGPPLLTPGPVPR